MFWHQTLRYVTKHLYLTTWEGVQAGNRVTMLQSVWTQGKICETLRPAPMVDKKIESWLKTTRPKDVVMVKRQQCWLSVRNYMLIAFSQVEGAHFVSATFNLPLSLTDKSHKSHDSCRSLSGRHKEGTFWGFEQMPEPSFKSRQTLPSSLSTKKVVCVSLMFLARLYYQLSKAGKCSTSPENPDATKGCYCFPKVAIDCHDKGLKVSASLSYWF